MSGDRVYLDTSFFIGLIEDQGGSRKNFRAILKWEDGQGNRPFTSILTLNEFAVRHYNKFRGDAECEARIDDVLAEIHAIARVYALNERVMRRSAEFMSVWGEVRKTQEKSPRDRKFRWDAIHLATADHLGVARVYTTDPSWKDFPLKECPGIASLVCPPRIPVPIPGDLFIKDEDEPKHVAADARGNRAEAAEPAKTDGDRPEIQEAHPAEPQPDETTDPASAKPDSN